MGLPDQGNDKNGPAASAQSTARRQNRRRLATLIVPQASSTRGDDEAPDQVWTRDVESMHVASSRDPRMSQVSFFSSTTILKPLCSSNPLPLSLPAEIAENSEDMLVTLKALVVVGLAALLCVLATATDGDNVHRAQQFTPLVTKESRRTLALTELGMITAVDVDDGYRGAYHLQFITMEPGSIFLPVLLHTDMVFYVHTGRGTVTFIGEGSEEEIDVVPGDVYRLEQGTTFYVKSHHDPARERLRIHAIFGNLEGLSAGVYSNISDLVRGFDDNILQMGFGVPAETIRGIKSAPAPSPIVAFSRRDEAEEPNWKEEIIEALVGIRGTSDLVNKKKKKKKSESKAFNFFKAKPDVKNANGWSIALTDKDLKALKGSDLAPFMVNLTRGSMMGPHWNPRASEIAIVIQGQGMVQLVCSSDASGKKIRGAAAAKCQRTKFKVEEGSVFVVPRFHPMAQISYNNETLVFVGFSSATKNNHPQFLAGKRSLLKAIDADVLAAAFNVNSSVAEGLLAAQGEAVMLPCTSCAEEMEREEEEAKKEREEEAKRKEEEEARKREEEAAQRREEEEEEAKKREEEEARRREEEEEERRREEEEEEEEKRRREEEERRREEEEEEERRREEEEERRREGEEEGEEEGEGRREN